MDIYNRIFNDLPAKTGLTPETLRASLKGTRIVLVDERVFITGTAPEPGLMNAIVETAAAYDEVTGVTDNTDKMVTPEAVSVNNGYSVRLQGWAVIPQKDMSQKIATRASILNAVPLRITDSFWGS